MPDTDPAELAREICLGQLAIRPRTRGELAETLRRRGIAADVVTAVLDRYGEVGLIDDQAFARAWVTSRHHGRGLARRALADELRRKGIDQAAIGAAVDELDEDTEEATARSLVARKLRTERGAPEATFRRLVGLLARKGYPAGLAIRVVKQALAEHEAAGDFAATLDVDTLADQVREEEAQLADD
jgi:regulatory protein